ncbi:hypothetical protein NBRC110019_15280 [Neptunitalea chrysea]|uniref:Uncharacterized protein n=1 Tax=Neptunitalea chrysea TaxID=1647581 RepID=A0A9W6B4H5_9FLAO|nr:hypothetical protein [Neptunitalea chrysea]GLB52488.1 hypothetical protein NBRC110019_15280 [Neptunitalea chrysea]
MTSFLFTPKELELINELPQSTPLKIWHDYHRYVLDYGSYSIQLSSEVNEAPSQNDFDEAIRTIIIKVNEPFTPTNLSYLISENSTITEVAIMQTKLFFTNAYKYSNAQPEFSGIGKKLTDTLGDHDEIICHPDTVLSDYLKKEHIHLIDAGLLLTINNTYLKTYTQNNAFGYPDYFYRKFFFTKAELTEEFSLYKTIEMG